MKYIFSCILSLAIFTAKAQQKFFGTWEGKLNAGVSLRIVFEFSPNTHGGIVAMLRSPDQSPKPLPADTSFTSGDSVYVNLKKFGISFSGKLTGDSTLSGSFVQGVSIPLSLQKVANVSEAKRPQTPQPPFPYISRDVEFSNADKSITFAGTLTVPAFEAGSNRTVYPAVLLISGSGPQDRDENLFEHKPFAVIADYLTKRGIAVLRVDDRGVGKSGGKFKGSTSADFALDAEAAIDYLKTLKEVDKERIGIVGHSEGAMIAEMIGAKRTDIKTLVLLAGPGVPIKQLMKEQVYAAALSTGVPANISKYNSELYDKTVDIVIKNKDDSKLHKAVLSMLESEAKKHPKEMASLKINTGEDRIAYANGQLDAFTEPWFNYFLKFDPAVYLKKINATVLALNGSKDVQVIPGSNLTGINAGLKKSASKKYETRELPGLNHLFQTCKNCSPTEYPELEETFSPQALQMIGEWLTKEL